MTGVSSQINTESTTPTGICGNDSKSNIADLERLMIQEKGEEEYFRQYNAKKKQMMDELDDLYNRELIKMRIEYFSKDHSRKEF